MFKTAKHTYKTLRHKDPNFSFSPDGITLVPRAGFEISSGCPGNYADIVRECINHGWLKPVAHMRDEELTWELLKYETLPQL
jgi:hypothetical protein